MQIQLQKELSTVDRQEPPANSHSKQKEQQERVLMPKKR
jgi:hypothetical protein